MTIDPSLKIDRLSIVFRGPKEADERKAIIGTIWDFCDPKKNDADTAGWSWADRSARELYHAAARVHFPSDNAGSGSKWREQYVLVQAGPRSGNGGFVRVEWNPAQAGLSGNQHVLGVLELLLPHGLLDIGKGKVTRIDLAVDIPGVRPGDVIWQYAGRSYREVRSDRGRAETIYLGRERQNGLCVYDKGVQAKLGPEVCLTRVEVRQKPMIRVAELPKLANPFARIQVYDPRLLKTPLPEATKLLICDAAVALGVEKALEAFPPTLQSDLRVGLLAARPNFWTPIGLWGGWHSVLASSVPIFGVKDAAAA